jgi:hypothetical protein
LKHRNTRKSKIGRRTQKYFGNYANKKTQKILGIMLKKLTQHEANELLMSNFKQVMRRKTDEITDAQNVFFEKLKNYIHQKVSGIDSQDTFFGSSIDKVFENRLYRRQKNVKMLIMYEIEVEVNDQKRSGYTFKINELHERQDLNLWMAKMEIQMEKIQKSFEKEKKRRAIYEYKKRMQSKLNG